MDHRRPHSTSPRSRVTRASTALFDADTSKMLPLGRHTPSAMPSRRKARGFEAVIASFNKSKQFAIRQLCIERLDLEHRLELCHERLQQTTQATDRKPTIVVSLLEQLKDNMYRLRKLSGTAFGTLLAVLEDPELRAELTPEARFEEDFEDGAVWRRRFLKNRNAGARSGYRNTDHNHPDARGNRTVWDEMNCANDDAGLSYYERQQRRYGRARRGSTSIAGAWQEVFAEDGSVIPSEGSDTHRMIDTHHSSTDETSRDRKGKGEESPSAAAAEAARRKAKELSTPGYELLTPDGVTREATNTSVAMQENGVINSTTYVNHSTGQTSGAKSASASESAEAKPSNAHDPDLQDGLKALLKEAQALVDEYHKNETQIQPRSPTIGSLPNQTEQSHRFNRSVSFNELADGKQRHGSIATNATNNFSVTQGTAVVPAVRSTPSAQSMRNKARGLQALIASHSLREQNMLREMSSDIVELLLRYETLLLRIQEQDDAEQVFADPPEALLLLEDALKAQRKSLVRAVGEEEANVILAHLEDPDVRNQLGFVPTSEEMAGDTESMRLWRRKLMRLRQVKSARAGYSALHDTPTSSGGRQVWNILNTADRSNELSYYQKQQLKYGRGRRGSTSIAGAWEQVLGTHEPVTSPSSSSPNSKSPKVVDKRDTGFSDKSNGTLGTVHAGNSNDTTNDVKPEDQAQLQALALKLAEELSKRAEL